MTQTTTTTTTTASSVPRGARTAEPSHSLGPLGLFTVLLGAALPLIDFFIVNVALPTIGRDLAASESVLELVVAGYGLAYAVLLVLGGRLGDLFGRRRLFLGGMAAFGLTSLACGLAPDAWSLVGARVAQGASAAAMVPQVLATIQSATAGRRRAKAMSLYGATAGLSMVGGPDPRRRAGRGRHRRQRLAVRVPGQRAVRRRRPAPGRPYRSGDPLAAARAGRRARHRAAGRLAADRCSPRSPRAGRRAGRCGRGCRWPRSRSSRSRSTRWSARPTGRAVRRWCRRACSRSPRCGAG